MKKVSMKGLYRIFMIPGLYLFLLCGALSKASGQATQTDTSLLLHLSFDDRLTGAAGEMPRASRNITYAQGISGKAVSLGSGSSITYDKLNNLREDRGSLEFWISPKWDINTETASILTYDGWGGLFFFRNFGSFRAIFNRFGFNNQPEVGLISNIADWKAGSWYFVAITWEDGIVKMYFNGQLVDQRSFNFNLPRLNDPVFTIGSEAETGNALLDELRISNRPKTATEIAEAYFRQLPGLSSLQVRDTSTIPMYPTWKIYLNKPGFWKVPAVYGLSGTDTISVPNSGMSWIAEDTTVAQIVAGELLAKKPGNTTLVGRLEQLSVRIPVRVAQPAKPVEYVQNIDPFLTTPAGGYVKEMPVAVIIYLPTLDGVNIDLKETQWHLPIPQQTVALAKAHTLGINKHTKFTLEEGSKFRGYQNKDARPYLGYRVVDYIIVYEGVPRGFPVPGSTSSFFTDFDQIIKRLNGRHYVEDLGVKEFWIHGVHSDEVVVVESNMSSPTTGDVSNSYRFQDDLPVYSKAYIAYNYNITRTGNEAVHNHGHQLEAMMSHAAWLQDGNADFFWQKFAGVSPGQGPLGRVGDTHHPPNTRNDYDYTNPTLVNSDILDWKPEGGKQTPVNVTTWDTLPYNWPSSMYPDPGLSLGVPGAESNWYLMWMQSFPGLGNQIPYGNRYMSNWWKMVHDWDAFHTMGLHQANPEPALSVSPDSLRFKAEGESKSLAVTSNSSWLVSTTADWLSLDKRNGSGNSGISVSATKNENRQPRTAAVEVKTPDGEISRRISVVQEGNAAALPDSWMVHQTENNHTIILTTALTSDIDGKPLAQGDYIGIFFQHQGKEICAGYGPWTGSNTSFPVFGDEASTPEKDGLTVGEAFRVKVWQASAAEELSATAEYAPLGTLGIVNATDRYANDGFSIMTRLKAARTETLTIPLKAGWNMVSSYVLPEQPHLDSILKQAPGLVEVVKDGAGMIYLSNPLINTIGAWKVVEGYRIRAGSNGDLRMEGKAVDPAQTPIPIRAGWQIIPVFSRTAIGITQGIADLSGKIEVLKDNAGNVYLPDLSINTIGQLQPGQGYRLKAKAAGELRYPAASMSVPEAAGIMDLASLVQDTQRYYKLPADYNTGANATLVFLADALNGKLQAGDEIGIFAADTLLCGAGMFKGSNLAVTVWGDDSTRPGRQGMQAGEPYQIKVWKHQEGTVYPVTVQYAQGDPLYQEDDVEIIRSIQLAPTSTAERLAPDALQVFPNPASGLFTLLPGQSLDGPGVLRAYSANGQLLHQERLSDAWPAGAGRTLDLSQAPEGMYLIQVLSRNGIWIGKVQVVRW